MIKKGAIGFIIGRKKRIMRVDTDADLLWQILVREIYILFKHFKTQEDMQKAFEKIKTTKNIPKINDIEKCKIFTDFTDSEIGTNIKKDWVSILRYCQHSYINILEAGYIVNENEENGLIFMLDFNKSSVMYYNKNFEGKTTEIQTSTLEEILNFEEMPTKTYTEIVSEMKIGFNEFYEKYLKIEKELTNLKKLKELSKLQNASNIEYKVNKLMDDMNWEKKKLHSSRRVFYNRLKALDLIDETN